MSPYAERQRVRVIDTETKVYSCNTGRCPGTEETTPRTKRLFAYRLGYHPFGNCIIAYSTILINDESHKKIIYFEIFLRII